EQLTVDLRPHRHGIERLDGADGVEIDRNVGLGGSGDQHRYWPVFGAEAVAAPLRWRAGEDIDQRASEHDNEHDNRHAAIARAGFRPELFWQFTVHRRSPPASAANRRQALDRD